MSEYVACDFCGALCVSDAPTTFSDENGDWTWCQNCENGFQAKVDAMSGGELADWLENQGGIYEHREGERIISILRGLNATEAQP